MADQFDAGFAHACAVIDDGTVRCWGDNNFGQLGDGNMPNLPDEPSIVCGIASCSAPLAGVKAITAGQRHTCALPATGSPICWGDNGWGELGNGGYATTDRPTVVSELTGVVSLAAGSDFTCAVRVDTTVWCWGANNAGQLGDNSTTASNVPVAVCDAPGCVGALTGALSVTAGLAHACALIFDGTVRCWGLDGCGQLGNGAGGSSLVPVVVCGGSSCAGAEASLTDVTQLSAGLAHVCAVLSAGTVRCWGANDSGQLGDGSPTNRTVPVAVAGLANATSVGSGRQHSCATVSDGRVRCWGRNLEGQLGDGGVCGAVCYSPVDVCDDPGCATSVGSAVAVSGGDYFACELTASGAVRCWGADTSGQLGDGDAPNMKDTPVLAVGVSLAGARAGAQGRWHGCLLAGDGRVQCWGRNENGQTGDATPGVLIKVIPGIVSSLASARGVAAGWVHTCATVMSGGVMCWGAGANGRLGNGGTADTAVPVPVAGLTDVLQVEAGYHHNCAVRATSAVWCWGLGLNGRLGNDASADSSIPVQVCDAPGCAAPFAGALSVSAGDAHTCAVMHGGTLRCWGYNAFHQLGDETAVDRATPVTVLAGGVPATGFVSVAAGGYHTCGLHDDGLVACWGTNGFGELGSTCTSPCDVTYISPVLLSDVIAIAAGFDHTCALAADGIVKCWGSNSEYQLGAPLIGSTSTPLTVPLPRPAVSIVAGIDSTCAILDNGVYYCWGLNNFAQLGDGYTDSGFITRTIIDSDGDGAWDIGDTCLGLVDPTQMNTDALLDNGPDVSGNDRTVPNSDAFGDACDPDSDNDGLLDAQDIEPQGSAGPCSIFAGSTDGHPNPAGGDITNDDNGDGNPAPPMGTDAADNGPSWDTDNDGVLDGVECQLGFNPRDAASHPSALECGSTADADLDGLPASAEKCKWGTSDTNVDSDGDGLMDCVEANDVNGDGAQNFPGDVLNSAKASALVIGRTMDFDLNGDGFVNFPGDTLLSAKMAAHAGGICM